MIFQSARLKLTLSYLLIILLISGLFSVAVYRNLTFELGRGLHMQALRFGPPQSLEEDNNSSQTNDQAFLIFRNPPRPSTQDIHIFEETKKRVAVDLLLINVAIAIVSGFAAYILAGRTLKPIEQMLDDQKRFVADASHELRTPLTAMKTEIEVNLRDNKLSLSNAKSILKSNLEEISKLHNLSDYLLSLSRYQADNQKLDLIPLSLYEVITKAIKRVTSLAKHKQIDVKLKPSTDFLVKGDQGGLIELFTILLDNAIKYSPPKTSIFINLTQVKGKVIVTIKDHGAGIKAGDIPYIFNRFYRADSSRSSAQVKGYGLGLSIAKTIIDLHHGKIEVISQPDKGSVFSVYLPA